jgi:hypothetical protein
MVRTGAFEKPVEATICLSGSERATFASAVHDTDGLGGGLARDP